MPHDCLGVDRVERAGGLVGQQQPPLPDHGAGDRHPLALAAGQLVRIAVGLVGQAQFASAASPAARAFRPGSPSSSSGRLTFSAAVRPGSRL